ncbi:MAG TPA: M13 family metallopeptidase N-terminal domain-containing protein, partial [Xanthomonadaceae bacterium]|nr:M13 family metallopeptidase N-terminal domain-containing protein [Xanthomonadaceae bacterium]
MTVLSAALAFAAGGAGAADVATPAPDFLASHLDTAVDPGVDFFEYANGGWLKAHPIPASEAAWGIGNEVDDELYARLRGISESAAAKPQAPGSDQQKIGDFWATAMDVARADRLGVHPLDAELSRIDAIRSKGDVLDTVFAFK